MTDPISVTLTLVVGKVFDALLGKLVGHVSDDLIAKLKGDPAKLAFKKSLTVAIKRYAANGTRTELAVPLLNKDGVLTETIVTHELLQILQFDHEPNYELIGNRWKSHIENPPQWRDFTFEANLLLGYLGEELRGSDVFRPVFESKNINNIMVNQLRSTDELESIEEQISRLSELLSGQFKEMLEAFKKAQPIQRDRICDFTYYINEKTRGFVGRTWLFDQIDGFIKSNPRGYVSVIGDPGIGKSAFSAQLVLQKGCAHHFNIRAEGINEPQVFLSNITAQLVAKYHLDSNLLPNFFYDASALNQVLREISIKIGENEKCIVVIDALDEVDEQSFKRGNNVLYLPTNLPPKVYFVLTARNDSNVQPRVECEQVEIYIKHDSDNNKSDITDYVRSFLSKAGIKSFIQRNNIDQQEFIDILASKSEGNFMYLRCILPSIESGWYQNIALDKIPVGLKNYYQDHWQRIRYGDEKAWFEYKLPVLVALSVAKEPVSVELLGKFSKVKGRKYIQATLGEWGPFLHETRVMKQEVEEKRYSLYHSSFFDFIATKQEVADERINLTSTQGQIADSIWGELFNE